MLSEIMQSRLNQLFLVLGVMGVSGLIISGFRLAIQHPLACMVVILAGACTAIAITMFAFAVRRRLMTQEGDAPRATDAVLELLLVGGPMTRSRLVEMLRMPEENIDPFLTRLQEEGWIEPDSGTLKLSESMKPIARRRIRREEKGS